MSTNIFNSIEICRNDFILSVDDFAAPSQQSTQLINNNYALNQSTTSSSSQILSNNQPAIEFNFILNNNGQSQASAPSSNNNSNNNSNSKSNCISDALNYFACPLNMIDEIEEESQLYLNNNNDNNMYCQNAPVIKKMSSSFVDEKDIHEVSEFTLRDDQSNQFNQSHINFGFASIDINDFSL